VCVCVCVCGNVMKALLCLHRLPEGFTQLLSLTQLYLNDAFLEFLPASFGRLETHRFTLTNNPTETKTIKSPDLDQIASRFKIGQSMYYNKT